MKNQHALLALSILILLSIPVRQQAAWAQPGFEASTTVPNPKAAQSEWREFSSRAGGFSVLMPGTPKEETEVKDFPVVGKGEVHLFVLSNEFGVFVAGYLDIPGLARQNQTFCDSFGKGFLKSIGDGTAKGAGGKVVKETDISFGTDPGKEILIEAPGGMATVRAYFIKRRGYQFVALPPAAGADAGNVKRFLDSFKLTAH
jgi:hypothetical protein